MSSNIAIEVSRWQKDGNLEFVTGFMAENDKLTRQQFNRERYYSIDKKYEIKWDKEFKAHYVGSYCLDLYDIKKSNILATITILKERYDKITGQERVTVSRCVCPSIMEEQERTKCCDSRNNKSSTKTKSKVCTSSRKGKEEI
jgi:hypothetical protein